MSILHIRKHEQDTISYMDYSGNIVGAKNRLKKILLEDIENNTLPDTYSIERRNREGSVYMTEYYSIKECIEMFSYDKDFDLYIKGNKILKENYREPLADLARIEDVL